MNTNESDKFFQVQTQKFKIEITSHNFYINTKNLLEGLLFGKAQEYQLSIPHILGLDYIELSSGIKPARLEIFALIVRTINETYVFDLRPGLPRDDTHREGEILVKRLRAAVIAAQNANNPEKSQETSSLPTITWKKEKYLGIIVCILGVGFFLWTFLALLSGYTPIPILSIAIVLTFAGINLLAGVYRLSGQLEMALFESGYESLNSHETDQTY